MFRALVNLFLISDATVELKGTHNLLLSRCFPVSYRYSVQLEKSQFEFAHRLPLDSGASASTSTWYYSMRSHTPFQNPWRLDTGVGVLREMVRLAHLDRVVTPFPAFNLAPMKGEAQLTPARQGFCGEVDRPESPSGRLSGHIMTCLPLIG